MTKPAPSADIVVETLCAYQRSAALTSAIDLELFTAIDEGAHTATAIAERCRASDRGTRILCDYLAVIGFLTKRGDTYQLVPESALFLSRRSPAYLGETARFYSTPALKRNFDHLTAAVRRGGVADDGATVADDSPIWVEFARAMGAPMMRAAQSIADLVGAARAGPHTVLDIAAGHGLFGITIARRSPRAEVVAVDWGPVLAVAEQHARAAGVRERYRLLPGDAFAVEFGHGYDIALVTNFLHHFPHEACVTLLRKVHAALQDGGRVALLEFVPNVDRVSPPLAAGFSLTMLASTPGGDAYTFPELQRQLESAGFHDVSAHPLPTPQTIVLAHK